MLSFDIAILEFPEDTDFGIEPVKLAKDYIEKEGDEAYITGFGAWWMEGNNSSGGSDVLRHDKISMINDCFGTLEICGGNSNQHALPGDSGGPMLIQRNNQWYQIGVCSSHSNYDFRTRVSSYCNFIEEVTKNEVKCESIFLESQILPLKHFEPIYNGQETPLKLFDFVIPFYNCYFSDGCTATVISKRHLLTSADCVYQEWLINFCQITDYSSYKSIHCVFFPDFRSKNVATPLKYPERVFAYFPLNYKWPYYHNLAVIEFPEGTDFGVKPVTLAKDYIQTYLENETLIVAGYGKHERDQNIPPLLHHSNASYKLYEPGLKIYHFENITFTQDNGGPTLIERNGKFYQIFVNYFLGTPSGILQNIYLNQDEGGPTLIEKNGKLYQVYVNYFNGAAGVSLSRECNFIEEVTKNEVKCESVAPIYEKPFESTTTFLSPFSEQFTLLPQKQGSPNNASRIVFQIKLFLFTIFTVFFL
uniref:Peptidase S1 domain-containing protein n=1 Tax=Panagrolaimus sp. ES5 TaxID=591445 RepID=A0AC34G3U3_9BILA